MRAGAAPCGESSPSRIDNKRVLHGETDGLSRGRRKIRRTWNFAPRRRSPHRATANARQDVLSRNLAACRFPWQVVVCGVRLCVWSHLLRSNLPLPDSRQQRNRNSCSFWRRDFGPRALRCPSRAPLCRKRSPAGSLKTRRICVGFESGREAVSRLERADRCGRVGRGCLTGTVSQRIEAELAFDHDSLRGRGSHRESGTLHCSGDGYVAATMRATRSRR